MTDCPQCGPSKWIAIPDSLAMACKGCGFVFVETNDGFERGASLAEWAADLAAMKSKGDLMETCPQCGHAAVTQGVCGFCGNGGEPTTDQRLLALEIKVELLERTIQEFLEQFRVMQLRQT